LKNVIPLKITSHAPTDHRIRMNRRDAGTGALIGEHRLGEGLSLTNIRIEHNRSTSIETRDLFRLDWLLRLIRSNPHVEAADILDENAEISGVHRVIVIVSRERLVVREMLLDHSCAEEV